METIAYQKKATNKEITIKTIENFNYLLEEIIRIRENLKNIGKQVGTYNKCCSASEMALTPL